MCENNHQNGHPRPPAPPPGYFPPFPNRLPGGQWTTGLCDCSDDPRNCLLACCCPCITMGRIAEIIDAGTTSCCVAGLIYCALGSKCCGKLYSLTFRSKLRKLFSLPEDPYSDTFVHCCCCVCALAQEYRELKNRGFDPALGWEANVEKWERNGVTVPPIVAPGMAR
ncbi:hypothetical protein NMG60_11009533 [Bertholletia excelsa]